MEPLKFTSSIETRSVVIEDPKDNKQTQFEIREMTAADRDKYMQTLSRRFNYDKEGKPCGLKTFTGLHAELLTLCMYQVQPSGEFTLVKKELLDSWPGGNVLQLYKEAQRLNHLSEREVENKPSPVEEAKNA